MTIEEEVVAVRRTVLLLVIAMLTGWMAGCAGGEEPEATPSSPQPASTAPSTSPATATPPSSPQPTGAPSTSPLVAPALPVGFSLADVRSPDWPDIGQQVGVGTAVRFGRHPGYDRVVFDFSGPGRPGYWVGYVDEPRAQGSGEVVDVPGEAYLRVKVSGVGYPEASDDAPDELSAGELEGTVVAGAPAIWGGFEGYGESFIGVRGRERPFRVLVLEDPTRVVVDVATG